MGPLDVAAISVRPVDGPGLAAFCATGAGEYFGYGARVVGEGMSDPGNQTLEFLEIGAPIDGNDYESQ